MFKIISIGILLFVLYRLIMPNKRISDPGADTHDIDYEEVD